MNFKYGDKVIYRSKLFPHSPYTYVSGVIKKRHRSELFMRIDSGLNFEVMVHESQLEHNTYNLLIEEWTPEEKYKELLRQKQSIEAWK